MAGGKEETNYIKLIGISSFHPLSILGWTFVNKQISRWFSKKKSVQKKKQKKTQILI